MRPEPEQPIAYIAGALNGMAIDYIHNMHRMIIWAEKIRKLGYAVFVPGIDLLQGLVMGDWEYADFFQNSQPFLQISHIVFVVPGWEKSKGTARELVTAKEYGVPIYYEQEGYEQLIQLEKDKLYQKLEGLKDEEH